MSLAILSSTSPSKPCNLVHTHKCLMCPSSNPLLILFLLFLLLLLLLPITRYLNDVFMLEIREGTSLQWQCPVIDGPTPCPRESQTAVTIGARLLIYGGMNGRRLGDIWMLDVGMSCRSSQY